MQSEIDLSQPRQAVYQSFEHVPGPCPRCGGRLRQSKQTYYVATRRGRKLLDSFIMSSDFGWYCDDCPVVVINSHQIGELLGHSMAHWDVGNEFCVEGLVDLDAIPEDKRHLPIGGAENPIPLIEFQGPGAAPPRQPLNKKERQQRKKLLERQLKGRRQNRRQTARVPSDDMS